MKDIALAIHGGAGNIDVGSFGADEENRCRRALEDILATAFSALQNHASALDVVELAVKGLEDFDGFNAGRGSVLTSAGTVEMHAAIMDGRDRRAGAVAGIQRIKNPVCGARAVMEHSNHVLLIGAGAEAFSRRHGLEQADPSYFVTERRHAQLERARAAQRMIPDEGQTQGTVGAVARDAEGHLAAATSTGGMTNSLPGRVGDSPLVGAGTWADDLTCAISGTGDGEALIRCAFAHEADSLMRYGRHDLESACRRVLDRVSTLDGKGGCIAVDALGNLALLFNTAVMHRAWIGRDGQPRIGIGADHQVLRPRGWPAPG